MATICSSLTMCPLLALPHLKQLVLPEAWLCGNTVCAAALKRFMLAGQQSGTLHQVTQPAGRSA